MRRLRLAWLIGALAVASAPVASGAPSRGETVFQQCFACHSVDPRDTTPPGPNLAGVVGRPAASLSGYAYSDAMVRARDKSNWVWSELALEYFLTDPQAVIPHTSMEFPGLKDQADRTAVIQYLKAHPAR